MTAYWIWVWSHAKHLVGPEIFTLVLICVFLIMALPLLASFFLGLLVPRVKGDLTSVNQLSEHARVLFTNEGNDSQFFAKCKILGQKNIPNAPSNITFDLQWDGSFEREQEVLKGDSRNLIVASWRMNDNQMFAMARLNALVGGETKSEGYFSWTPTHKSDLPSYDVEIQVLGRGKRGFCKKYFTVTPATLLGPLKLVEYTPTSGGGVA